MRKTPSGTRAPWALHPVVLLGSTCLSVAWLQRWNAPITALVGGLTCAVVVIVLAERLWPFRSDWRAKPKALLTDLCHSFVNLAVPNGYAALLHLLTVGLFTVAPGFSSAWPAHWPLLMQVGAAILLGELGTYAMHRAVHAHPGLWRFHAVHHGPKNLYWLNANRFHPLDLLLLHAASVTPLVLLGAPPVVLAACAVFSQVSAFLQHSNIAVGSGALSRLFNTPEHHRWHHSAHVREGNHNFGGALILWDLLFGTLHFPGRRTPSELGVQGAFASQRYTAQLVSPFLHRSTRG